jgi:drug/metabolite transporter (DMT)-like permease
MLFVVLAWAANFIVVKAANREIPPITFAFMRFSLGAVLLMLALRWREGSVRMPRREVLPIVAVGVLGFGVYQILWATALQSIPAGNSAFLIASSPVFTVLLAAWVGSDTLTTRKLGGAFVSFAGVAIVVAAGPGIGLGASIVGDLVTIAAAACWAAYVAWGAPILARHSPLRTTAWAMTGGCLVLAPVGLAQATSADWGAVSAAAWTGFAYSALIPVVVTNVVVFHAIRLLGPTHVTGLQFLVPFVAVLMGAAFLAEPVQAAQIAGGAVIILGVAVARSFGIGGVVARARALGSWVP